MNDSRMPQRQAAFRDDFRRRIAKLYNGPLHVLMIFAIGIATIWYCSRQVQGPVWTDWLIIPIAFIVEIFSSGGYTGS